MRMETEIARPGLKHGEQAQLRAEVFVRAADVLQSGRAVAKQERVEDFLVGADDRAQLFRDGEGDQVIRHGQESPPLALQPFGGVGVAALGTGAMIAGVISKVLSAAVAPEEL